MPFDPKQFADMVAMTVTSMTVPILERLAATEARLEMALSQQGTLTELRDRVVTMEAKAAVLPPSPTVVPAEPIDLSPLDGRVGELAKDLGTMRERMATLEARAPIPGPVGPAGKDGVDGLGWGELTFVQDADERTVHVAGEKDGRIKTFGSLTFPVDIYRGVWVEGKTYDRGDGVTWGGSEWHCNEATTAKPGDGSKAWTLKVKRGRDGKDGKDGTPPPIVSVKP